MSIRLFLALWYPIQNRISGLFDQILFCPSVHSSRSGQNRDDAAVLPDHDYQLHEVDQAVPVLPGVLAVTAQGANIDVLGEIQLVESFGEQLDCVVDKRSLSLRVEMVPLKQIILFSFLYLYCGVIQFGGILKMKSTESDCGSYPLLPPSVLSSFLSTCLGTSPSSSSPWQSPGYINIILILLSPTPLTLTFAFSGSTRRKAVKLVPAYLKCSRSTRCRSCSRELEGRLWASSNH